MVNFRQQKILDYFGNDCITWIIVNERGQNLWEGKLLTKMEKGKIVVHRDLWEGLNVERYLRGRYKKETGMVFVIVPDFVDIEEWRYYEDGLMKTLSCLGEIRGHYLM